MHAPHPFEKGELHVSHSQVSSYLLCPEQFRQRYVKCVEPSFRSAELVFGSAMHAALARYHAHLMSHHAKPPLEDILTEFDELLLTAERGPVPILWEDDEGPAKVREQGHALLKLYYDEVQLGRVLAVEHSFSIPLLTPSGRALEERLVGVVDLIEQDADGKVYITELKTAARRFDQTRLRFDRQMSLYAAAARALGYPDAGLRFRVLLKLKKPAIEAHVVHRDEAQVVETTALVAQVLRAIEQGIFYPLRGWVCQACPYRPSCGE